MTTTVNPHDFDDLLTDALDAFQDMRNQTTASGQADAEQRGLAKLEKAREAFRAAHAAGWLDGWSHFASVPQGKR